MTSAFGEQFMPELDTEKTYPVVSLPLGRAIADDLVASAEIPECSVAASDTAECAEELFNSTTKRRSKNLMLSDNEFLSQEVSLAWVTPETDLGTGHAVRFGLGLPHGKYYEDSSDDHDPAPRLTLYAVTRRNIAFPLARFGRANQVYCDHVQFWGEEDGDELDSNNFYGWGEDDNGSRFNAVQSLLELLKGSKDAHIQLIEQLQLEKRFEDKLGPTTPESEQLISYMFSKRFKNATHTFSQEYYDLPFGKIHTNITAEGVLSPIKDEQSQRRFVLRTFPTSQADRNWEPREFIADLHGNITTQDGAAQPRTLDAQIMLDLLKNAEPQKLLEAVDTSQPEEQWNICSTYAQYYIGSFLGFSAFQGVYKLLNDQDFTFNQFYPRVNGSALISAFVLTAISGIASVRRDSRRSLGGEEEEA